MPKILSSVAGVGGAHSQALRVAAAGAATLGTDLTVNGAYTSDLSGWTVGSNWAWNSGAQHTTGSTATLSQTATGVKTNSYYYIQLTITGRTSGSVTVALGSVVSLALNTTSTAKATLLATANNPALTITPTTDFNGTLTKVSVQEVASAKPQVLFESPAGSAVAEVRAMTGSIGMGSEALSLSFANSYSTAVGYRALRRASNGVNNTAVGYNAMPVVTLGSSNVAVGRDASAALIDGNNNIAVGYVALAANVSGYGNVAIGYAALTACTSIGNVSIGENALKDSTTGQNVALGFRTGFQPAGQGANTTTTGTRQTLLGNGAGQASATQVNDVIAIGNNAVVGGNNAVAIGSGTSANAAGAVVIGRDSAGTAASTATVNDFLLGTTLHTVRVPGALVCTTTVDASSGFRHGSATMPSWTKGAGTPEGAVTAPVGSLFSRTDGGTDTAIYRKEAGTGNTGWVATAGSSALGLYVRVAGDNMTGNLGLGAPSPTAKLQFASDTTSAGGILFGTDTTLYRGGPDTLKTDDQLVVQCSIDKATLLQGANIRPVNVGVGDVYGIDVLAGTSASANQVVGVNVGMSQANISGLVQNYYGVRVVPPALATGSGFWNGYAVYIDAQGPTGVITASYGVYQVGATERNYFNGNVGLGTISPTLSRLQFVAGTTVADGITFGTDTNLYRSAANVLSTDDTFVSAATVQAAPGSGFRQGASGPVWLAGAGTPEGAITAPIGSIYSRTDGTTGTALYRKETGVSNTGWAAVASSGGVTSVDGRSGVVTLSDLYVDVAGDNMTGNLGLGFPSPTHKLQFAAATTLVGGISFGTDTHLYRGGTTSLVTDSKLTLGGVLDCPDAAGDKALWSSTTFLTGTAATTLYHDVPANSVHEFRAAGLWRTRISNTAVTHNTSIYLDLAGNELRNAVTQNLASAPGTPVEGLRYYDSTLKVERFWNGSSWVGGGGVSAHATSHYAGGSDPLTGKLGLNTSTRAGDGGNVVVGASAMPLSSSGSCTAVGVFAMKAQDLGYNNTAVGYDCCPDLVNSYQNVAVGLWAGKGMASGYNNVAIGFTSNVADWSTGAVAIGANTSVMASNIAIGVGVTAMHDNAVGIGASSTATNDFVLGTATHLVRAPGMLGLGTIPTARLHLVADTVAGGGVLFGTDTNLYRSATGVLTTDGTFASGVTVQAALSKTVGGFRHGASGPTWVAGTGTPESVVTAPIGSIYSRTDGAAGTAFYRKETGTGNTGWSAVAAGGGGVTSVDSRTGVVTLTDKYLQLSGGTLAEAANIALGATTGSKIGTAITQKLGFWNAAPVIQNTGWSVTAGYTADKSFNPESTTLTEVARALGTLVDAMKTYGLLG
jgi:hypothetical protein